MWYWLLEVSVEQTSILSEAAPPAFNSWEVKVSDGNAISLASFRFPLAGLKSATNIVVSSCTIAKYFEESIFKYEEILLPVSDE